MNNLLPILAPGWISIPVKNLPICETSLAKKVICDDIKNGLIDEIPKCENLDIEE